MIDQTVLDLVTAVDSLKIRLARTEAVLLNFSGVTRDADGVLMYSAKTTPTPIPETTPETETPIG